MADRLLLGPTLVDLGRREVHRGDDPVLLLSQLEVALLEWLRDHPGEPADRDRLLVEVWGYPKPIATRSVDHMVNRLRRKIEVDPSNPVFLCTVRGRGYVLDLPDGYDGGPSQARNRAGPVAASWTVTVPPTSFFGREDELALLEGLVTAGHATITVTGPGGAGKTRLLARWLQTTDHPVTAVAELADAADLHTAAARVASALGLPATTDPAGAVGAALAERDGPLLVLDNLEQLMPDVVGLLRDWAGVAADLQLVVTSRVRLGLAGERLVQVAGLAPDAAQALYLARAVALDAGWGPTDADVHALDAVLDTLGHHPLSIELLAGRVRTLRPHEVGDRLSRPLRLLAGGPADAAPRHRSLSAAIRGSWDLLDADAQRSFAALGVLSGPFDLDLAEAVLDEPDGPWPMDVLETLCDASLVQRREAEPPFVLLPALRAFARARLAERDDERAVAERAARFLHARGRRAAEALQRADGPRAARQLAVDGPHLRPLARWVEDADPALAAQLRMVYLAVGHPPGAVEVEGRLLAQLPRIDDAVFAAAIRGQVGRGRVHRGDVAGALDAVAPVLDETRAGGGHPVILWVRNNVLMSRRDWSGMLANIEVIRAHPAATDGDRASALNSAGAALDNLGRKDEAAAVLKQAIRDADAAGLVRLAASARTNLAVLHAGRPGGDAVARSLLAEALDRVDPAAAPMESAFRLNYLAWMHLADGAPEAARPLAEQAAALLEGQMQGRFGGQVTATRSWIALMTGDLDGQLQHLHDLLAIARRAGDRVNEASVLAGLAHNAARRGDVALAESRFAEADAVLAGFEPPAPLVVGGRLTRCALPIARATTAAGLAEAERAYREARAAAESQYATNSYVRIADHAIRRFLDEVRGRLG